MPYHKLSSGSSRSENSSPHALPAFRPNKQILYDVNRFTYHRTHPLSRIDGHCRRPRHSLRHLPARLPHALQVLPQPRHVGRRCKNQIRTHPRRIAARSSQVQKLHQIGRCHLHRRRTADASRVCRGLLQPLPCRRHSHRARHGRIRLDRSGTTRGRRCRPDSLRRENRRRLHS